MSSSSWLKQLSGVSPSRCFPVADSAAMVVALPKGSWSWLGLMLLMLSGESIFWERRLQQVVG